MNRRALVIGHRGGVGASLLHLLEAHPAARDVASQLDALFVVDREAGPSPHGSRVLDPTAAADPEALARTLRDHRIDQVIEVADVVTRETSEVCAAAGADYLSASVMGNGPTMIAARELLTDRPDTNGTSQLIGAGMNPGVVNALVLAGIDELARRVGRPPTELDLYAIHVTEQDTTAIAPPGVRNGAISTSFRTNLGQGRYATPPGVRDGAISTSLRTSLGQGRHETPPGVRDGAISTSLRTSLGQGVEGEDGFAMSWSPEHALEELLEPHAMYVAAGEIARLDHRPCDALYIARCGDREMAGMIVPHEELLSIGARFPGVEAAFFYAIPDAAAAALTRHPDRRPSEWRTQRLYAPHVAGLTGHDRVGVLIASRRYGELWLGYEHAAATHGAGNGTLLQAAAGVLAGWSLLGRPGIHTTDELDARAYLAIVESVLGPRRICYVPDAMPRTVASRKLATCSPRSFTSAVTHPQHSRSSADSRRTSCTPR